MANIAEDTHRKTRYNQFIQAFRARTNLRRPNDREVKVTWTRKNRLQKGIIVHDIEALEAAFAAVAALAPLAQNSADAAAQALTNAQLRLANPLQHLDDDHDWWLLAMRRAEEAHRAHRQLEGPQRNLCVALGALCNTTIDQDEHFQVQNFLWRNFQLEAHELARIIQETRRFDRDWRHPQVPPLDTGEVKVRAYWLEVFEEFTEQKAERRRAQFLGGGLGYDCNGLWLGGWPLPQGAQSVPGLWVELDQHQRVRRCVVRKDTYGDTRFWRDNAFFDGDLGRAEIREPYEIVCHSDLEAIPSRYAGNVKVPEILNDSTNNGALLYRMYLEWCPHGDLESLMTEYAARNEMVPEPFLWLLFLTLAEAGHAMEFGHVDLTNHPAINTAWKEIVHRDLKPENIFLGHPTPGFFDTYPAPKLGDFGMAIKTHPNDPINPRVYCDEGTPGYHAPEQLEYANLNTYESMNTEKLLAHTNVFGIGMTMAAVMSRQNPPVINYLGPLNHHRLRLQVRNMLPHNHGYSNWLIDLVQQCISVEVWRRPTFKDLMLDIERNIDVNRRNLARGMQHPHLLAPDQVRLYDLSHVKRDAYTVGLARAQLPALGRGVWEQ